ncbi:MAG: 6-phosphofructokinase [Candidatus Margulisbacteria bacterium]|nr:6-phosphofructokinase [Candidatus Margulisiibacteriota bacterium]
MRVSTLVTGGKLAEFRTRGLRIGILHAGGPAPGGNEVCFAAALRARDHGIPLLAFRHGYQSLQDPAVSLEKLGEPDCSFELGLEQIRYLRDQDALVIGTSRDNPAQVSDAVKISKLEDLDDLEKTAKLLYVISRLNAMRIGALISIGGDDTMKTANLVQMCRDRSAQRMQRVELTSAEDSDSFLGVVHVPKTIDKDYHGIDFTFGYMSAVDFIGRQIRGFHADAKAAGTKKQPVVHIVEVMGRGASWLTAGAAIIGEANYTIALEDYADRTVTFEDLARNCVDMILTRRRNNKHYAVIAIAEGVAERLPKVEAGRDEHGHVKLDEVNLGEQLKTAIAAELSRRSGRVKAKIHAHKAGYNARQVRPVAYDVLLCRALGVAAVDAVLRGDYGNMVSMTGVFTPKLVPFAELIDPQTLKVRNWTMTPNEGLNRLLRAMETPFEENVDLVQT